MILGLDISLCSTGIVVMDYHSKIVHAATIDTKPSNERFKRYDYILCELDKYISPKIKKAMVEGYAFGTHGNLANIAELSGILKHHLWLRNIFMEEVPPSTLKKYATGKGNADKIAMMAAALSKHGIKFDDNNICDAFWLARLGLDKVK